MSGEITASLMEQLAEHLSATATYVLLYLWAKTQERGNSRMTTSYAKLGAALSINRSSIRRALKRLVNLKYIEFDLSQRSTDIHINNINQILTSRQEPTQERHESDTKQARNRTVPHGSSPSHSPISHIISTGVNIKSTAKIKRFEKPQPLQVTEYAKSIGFDLSGSEFCDFYESKGWVIGKSPMKDWKAAVRTWKKGAPPHKIIQPVSQKAAEPPPPEPSEEDLVQMHLETYKLTGKCRVKNCKAHPENPPASQEQSVDDLVVKLAGGKAS